MPALKTSKRCNQRNKYYLRVYLDSVNTYQKEIQAYVWSLSEKNEELSGKKHFVLQVGQEKEINGKNFNDEFT